MKRIVLLLICSLFLLTTETYASHYEIYNEDDRIVYVTGWHVRVGDQFITEDNMRYQIDKVEEGRAKAHLIGRVAMIPYDIHSYACMESSVAEAADVPKVAIYHTHTDESYKPSDGTDSINGKGGIIEVGNAFATALEAHGIEVTHSDTVHNPHDDMAYERSRRTAVHLIKNAPDAIFDIHRDATPPDVYAGVVSNEKVAKLQLVVGKYGATSEQIEEYALQLKAASDKVHPGLVKGIFFAKGGDYNQDLHPRSMLIEAGAHTNSREEAEKGIAMFADAIPPGLMKKAEAAGAVAEAAGVSASTNASTSGSMRSIMWVVGIAIVGGIGFLIMSTGSLHEAKEKVKNFAAREFGDVFGKKDSDKENK
jgi:stage II sporulation protein P